MREGTSGFWTTQKDGKITIEYVDFGVSEFGGNDFEKTYCLDKENAEKFVAELQKQYEGTLDEMIESAFGKKFQRSSFLGVLQKSRYRVFLIYLEWLICRKELCYDLYPYDKDSIKALL